MMTMGFNGTPEGARPTEPRRSRTPEEDEAAPDVGAAFFVGGER